MLAFGDVGAKLSFFVGERYVLFSRFITAKMGGQLILFS
jgi:hypothetical protein